MTDGETREPLDAKLEMVGAFIDCCESHRQTESHRCRLHSLLARFEAHTDAGVREGEAGL